MKYEECVNLLRNCTCEMHAVRVDPDTLPEGSEWRSRINYSSHITDRVTLRRRLRNNLESLEYTFFNLDEKGIGLVKIITRKKDSKDLRDVTVSRFLYKKGSKPTILA